MIHAFNESGFAARTQMERGPTSGGWAVREQVCRVAKTPPVQLGRPFPTWWPKLIDYLGECARVRTSVESVRQILHAAGIRSQETKSSARLYAVCDNFSPHEAEITAWG